MSNQFTLTYILNEETIASHLHENRAVAPIPHLGDFVVLNFTEKNHVPDYNMEYKGPIPELKKDEVLAIAKPTLMAKLANGVLQTALSVIAGTRNVPYEFKVIKIVHKNEFRSYIYLEKSVDKDK